MCLAFKIICIYTQKLHLVSPHSAAHRISELNLFLYLRISGVSLGGRVLVGLTFTIDPFLTSIFSCSNLEPSEEAQWKDLFEGGKQNKQGKKVHLISFYSV